MTTQASDFTSAGTRCAGELLTPENATTPPVIIMAHGFAATREMALPRFAERFLAAGYAVYLFDYRTFGGSDGEPRHWVDPARHLQDWLAALNHVRQLKAVDSQRIILWGSSFSGGHVLVTAAKNPDVKAVISQVPHVDGLATLRAVPLSSVLRMSVAGLRDLLGGLLGHPLYSPVVGHPGELAAMSSPEAYDGYMSIVIEDAAVLLGQNLGFHWTVTCANDVIEGGVAIPEPASILLFGLAFAGVAFVTRRREKS